MLYVCGCVWSSVCYKALIAQCNGQKWPFHDCVAAFALPISSDVEAHVGEMLFSHAGDGEINSQLRGKNNGRVVDGKVEQRT